MIKALRIFSEKGGVVSRVVEMNEHDLTPGELMVRVHYSGVNYKDALAGAGKGKILKHFPLNGGIDAAGVVESSSDSRFRVGQEVLVNGMGIGETFDGGFAEKIRLSANSVVIKPSGLTLRETMILGTAGFTAALALFRMEQNGQQPEKGPIVVTGASGGVGSFAIQILKRAGYESIAVSGKASATEYLKELGANQIVTPEKLNMGDRPLESVRFGGGIDNVGGKLLGQILAHTQLWGNVASIGMAESAQLPTTVMPFILRGVSLLGASSNNTPIEVRQQIWNRLGAEWKPAKIDRVLAKTIRLEQLPQAFTDLLERRVTGRILVEL